MSAEECIMAGTFQNQHPSPCKLATEGHFGSKFVTCIVTGMFLQWSENYAIFESCTECMKQDKFYHFFHPHTRN